MDKMSNAVIAKLAQQASMLYSGSHRAALQVASVTRNMQHQHKQATWNIRHASDYMLKACNMQQQHNKHATNKRAPYDMRHAMRTRMQHGTIKHAHTMRHAGNAACSMQHVTAGVRAATVRKQSREGVAATPVGHRRRARGRYPPRHGRRLSRCVSHVACSTLHAVWCTLYAALYALRAALRIARCTFHAACCTSHRCRGRGEARARPPRANGRGRRDRPLRPRACLPARASGSAAHLRAHTPRRCRCRCRLSLVAGGALLLRIPDHWSGDGGCEGVARAWGAGRGAHARTPVHAFALLACGFRHARLARRRACACLHREMCSVRPRQQRASTLQARFAAPRSPGADVAGAEPSPRCRCGSGRDLAIALDRFILVMLGIAAQRFSSRCPVCGSN
jgi:hypothetical protein